MIYWDANSTSRLRPVAVETINKFVSENRHLNPSSIHQEGRFARGLLRQAREQILFYLFPEVDSRNRMSRLVFTSGGTESCNAIISGFVEAGHYSSYHLVSSAIEHSAILEPLRKLEALGSNVDFVEAGRDGRIDIKEFVSAIKSNTSLATLMYSNNETGASQPLLELAREIKKISPSCVVVSDITQGLSKTNISVQSLFDAGVDAVTISAHKIGALPVLGPLFLIHLQTAAFFIHKFLVADRKKSCVVALNFYWVHWHLGVSQNTYKFMVEMKSSIDLN